MSTPDYFQYILPGQSIVIAFSGGPDSVYLLNKCLNLELKPKIILAYVNHHLRDQESQQEELFVRKIAKKYKLDLAVCQAKKLKQKPGNLEENARKLRYSFFEEVRKQYQADWILTAHHLNDQIETILFNFSRGINLKGLLGIQVVDPQNHLLRPLINVPKQLILETLKESGKTFHLDSSNQNIKFSRNRIRQEIIPAFESINPSFVQTFQNSIHHLQDILHFLDQSENVWINEHLAQNKFDLDNFLTLPAFAQKQILQKLFERYNQQSITSPQITEILKTLSQNRSNRKKEFGVQHEIIILKNPQNQKREVVIRPKIH